MEGAPVSRSLTVPTLGARRGTLRPFTREKGQMRSHDSVSSVRRTMCLDQVDQEVSGPDGNLPLDHRDPLLRVGGVMEPSGDLQTCLGTEVGVTEANGVYCRIDPPFFFRQSFRRLLSTIRHTHPVETPT